MNNKCYLCDSKNIRVIHNGTRDNPNVDVMECCDCKLVFLSSFDHIKDEVYEKWEMHIEKDRININDYREKTKNDDLRRVTILSEKMKEKDILDFGCGNGGFITYASKLVNVKSIKGIELEKKRGNI